MIRKERILIAPSILNSNFFDLENTIKLTDKADFLHLDIMDGNFVQNISFGPEISKQISEKTLSPLDVHLMTKDPEKWFDKFNFLKTEFITFHLENENVHENIKKIHDLGIKAGLSLRPATDILKLTPYLEEVDLILIMSVDPGFGGQKFINDTYQKIDYLASIREKNGYHFLIEVDGGINEETFPILKKTKVDILVVGSYLFKSGNPYQTLELLKEN
ncbi:MAG: ribulose-phosphate 3-epimerase [Acholeplasmatales bacterium]|jgi:ribulose-phosphate 3-epimerase|nr:ribulose-phosphate 3-epimerase [Acholeplasmatales bacterium]